MPGIEWVHDVDFKRLFHNPTMEHNNRVKAGMSGSSVQNVTLDQFTAHFALSNGGITRTNLLNWGAGGRLLDSGGWEEMGNGIYRVDDSCCGGDLSEEHCWGLWEDDDDWFDALDEDGCASSPVTLSAGDWCQGGGYVYYRPSSGIPSNHDVWCVQYNSSIELKGGPNPMFRYTYSIPNATGHGHYTYGDNDGVEQDWLTMVGNFNEFDYQNHKEGGGCFNVSPGHRAYWYNNAMLGCVDFGRCNDCESIDNYILGGNTLSFYALDFEGTTTRVANNCFACRDPYPVTTDYRMAEYHYVSFNIGATDFYFNNNTIGATPCSIGLEHILRITDGSCGECAGYYDTLNVDCPCVTAFGNVVNDDDCSVSDPGPIEYSAPTVDVFMINNDDATTSSTYVNLEISVSDAGSGMGSTPRFGYFEGGIMQFSNDNEIWHSVMLYESSVPWILPSGYGIKTVYARFRDRDGNWTNVVVDDILLDQN